MPWLKMVDPSTVSGYVKAVFDGFVQRRGKVPSLSQVLANRPEVLRGRETLRNAVSDGATTLGLRREEMLNYFGSMMGQCTG